MYGDEYGDYGLEDEDGLGEVDLFGLNLADENMGVETTGTSLQRE